MITGLVELAGMRSVTEAMSWPVLVRTAVCSIAHCGTVLRLTLAQRDIHAGRAGFGSLCSAGLCCSAFPLADPPCALAAGKLPDIPMAIAKTNTADSDSSDGRRYLLRLFTDDARPNESMCVCGH